MGSIWRINMVLLSTLAALVIIVHSAEEEYENQYMRGLRPRALDTGTRRYEQPWRTLDVEPVMHQSTSRAELEEHSSEEPPRRRRPGRKRKRRPEPTSAEDSNERISEEHVRPQYNDFSNEHPTSELPKRRRKKHERRIKWTDSLEEDRPIRRRGQRRKRPLIETWAEQSEFNDYRPNQAARNVNEEATTDQIKAVNEEVLNKNPPEEVLESREVFDDVEVPSKIEKKYTNDNRNDFFVIEDGLPSNIDKKQADTKDNRRTEENYRPMETKDSLHITPDKSLSEFSLEDLETEDRTTETAKLDMYQKMKDKSPEYFKEFDKVQVSGPIDPLTLKDILKKSNGTSLSEILQQHNLSLADLLHGKELALSILKSENKEKIQLPSMSTALEINLTNKPIHVNSEENESSEEKLLINSETKYVTEPITEMPTTSLVTFDEENITTVEVAETTTDISKEEEPTKRPSIIRFPIGNRRKQRIRPVINNNYKSQLNRDMLALTSRKYFYNNRRRNTTKSHEWKDVIPLMKNVSEIVNDKPKVEAITLSDIEATTIYEENIDVSTIGSKESNTILNETIHEVSEKETLDNETKIVKVDNMTKSIFNEIDNPKLIPSIPQAMNTSGLRRQAFNNILKKKRRKQKYSTTESPLQDDFMKNLFGMPNLVSSSEFIARTQGPKTSLDDVTILEDFMTTEVPDTFANKPSNFDNKPKHNDNKPRKNRHSTKPPTTYNYRQIFIPSSTEESAKIEIEEILNDTRANVKLSKILMERNMTLSELVEHRERGSSHVHLADIFHNTSKEPNPPEPFLSKSAIEPISKETYPLRALLDAHDTTTKGTTMESVQTDFIHIPMKMDFGNNVNENAENMGIMSLFNNITKTDPEVNARTLMKDSHGTPYSASIIVVNTTDGHNETETVRESRVMHPIDDNPDDIVGWNEIFSLVRRNYENKTKELTGTYLDGLIPAESIRKPSLEEDLDGDGLIVLEDLQRLNDFSSKISSDEKLDASTIERTEAPTNLPGTIDKTTNLSMNGKSVTLATASIVGLAMVLFLLTYIGYRWRQQRALVDLKNFPDERIPTPVFENRKGHKNNSSTRSISPMLTSNIYTLSTLDSQNGKESPDYMWDSLRKPFQ